MLGTILISGLLLSSPDTVGFTLVPKHTVYLDRTFNSFNEIVKAREGIYDLGVGSINIPLASDSLQLAIIVYGSERARELQIKRVETFLNRQLTLISGEFTYFGTPYGGPQMASLTTQSAPPRDSTTTTLNQLAVAALDSMLAAEHGSDLKNILESNERQIDLKHNSELDSLILNDDIGKNSLLVLRQDSLDAYLLYHSVTLNKSSQSALDVLSTNSESALSILNNSAYTNSSVPSSLLEGSKGLPTSPTPYKSNDSRDTTRLVQLEVNITANAMQQGSKTNASSNALKNPKEPTPPIKEQPKVISKNPQNDITKNSQNPNDLPLPISDQIRGMPQGIVTTNVPKTAEKPISKLSESVSKSSSIPPVQGSNRTARKSIEQFTSSIRKPYREIEIKEQERGRYYIVFGHFTSKPNASHYARGIRKRYPETHLAPSKQGFRVLMEANQDAPVDQLRLVRTEFPKAWLSKPRKTKLEFEGD
jgi:hypothetical protein